MGTFLERAASDLMVGNGSFSVVQARTDVVLHHREVAANFVFNEECEMSDALVSSRFQRSRIH